jgi:hypothetical protein
VGHFSQLQYVQTVILNFPILNTNTNLSWPHVSAATTPKDFWLNRGMAGITEAKLQTNNQ